MNVYVDFFSNRVMSLMVEKGWLGKKTGKGFYLYPKDAKKGAPKELNKEMLSILSKFRVENGYGDKEGVHGYLLYDLPICTYICMCALLSIYTLNVFLVAKIPVEDIQMRLITRFINEAAYCLQGE